MVKQIRLTHELPLFTVQHEAPCRHYSTSLPWEKSQLHRDSESTFSQELQNLGSAPFFWFLWHSPLFPSLFSITQQNTDSGTKMFMWGIITPQSCTKLKQAGSHPHPCALSPGLTPAHSCLWVFQNWGSLMPTMEQGLGFLCCLVFLNGWWV